MWIIFAKNSLLNLGQTVRLHWRSFLFCFRSLVNSNCLHSSLSLLLIAEKENFLVEVLRCFSFMQVFLNPSYYGKHCKFDLAFNSKKDKTSSLHFFFFNFFQISILLSLKNVTLDQFSNDNICTLKNEAIVNRKGSEWSSYLSSGCIICPQRPSFYSDGSDVNYKHLFNCKIIPRTWNVRQKCFRILFCCNETFGSFFRSARHQTNRFAPFLPTHSFSHQTFHFLLPQEYLPLNLIMSNLILQLCLLLSAVL